MPYRKQIVYPDIPKHMVTDLEVILLCVATELDTRDDIYEIYEHNDPDYVRTVPVDFIEKAIKDAPDDASHAITMAREIISLSKAGHGDVRYDLKERWTLILQDIVKRNPSIGPLIVAQSHRSETDPAQPFKGVMAIVTEKGVFRETVPDILKKLREQASTT